MVTFFKRRRVLPVLNAPGGGAAGARGKVPEGGDAGAIGNGAGAARNAQHATHPQQPSDTLSFANSVDEWVEEAERAAHEHELAELEELEEAVRAERAARERYAWIMTLSPEARKLEEARFRRDMNAIIDKVLQRGDRIEKLVERHEEIVKPALKFKKRARKLRNAMWWKNVEKTALCVLFVALVIYFILAIACSGFDSPGCR